jgi:uncharacterized protein
MKLIAKILGSIARFSAGNPKKIIIAAICATLVAAALASTIDISMKFNELLPKGIPALQKYKEGIRDFGRGQFVIVMIESPKGVPASRYKGFIKLYKDRLEKLSRTDVAKKDISKEKLERMAAHIRDHLMMIVDESDLVMANDRLSPEAMKKALKRYGFMKSSPLAGKVFDPLGLIALVEGLFMPSGSFTPDVSGEFFVTGDDSVAFFIIGTNESAGYTNYTNELVSNAENIEAKLVKRLGYSESSKNKYSVPPKVSLIGMHMIIRDDRRDLIKTVASTTIFSLVGIALLFLLFFSRGRTLVFAYIPMMIGVVWSFGCAKLTVGSLNVITVGLGAIIIGLGIDFPAYLLNAYYRRREEGAEFMEALTKTWSATGRSVFYGALTTSAAFFVMTLANFKAFSELGIIAGVGLLVTFFAVITILPALLSLWGRDYNGRAVRRYPDLLARFPLNHAKKAFVLCIALFIIFGFFAGQLKMISPVRMVAETFHSQDNDSIKALKRFSHQLGVMPVPILFITRGDDEESALESNDALMSLLKKYQNEGRVGYIDTLANWMPSKKREEALGKLLPKLDNLNPDNFKKNYIEATSDISGKWLTMHDGYGDAIAKFLASTSPVSWEDVANSGMESTIDQYLKKTPDGYRIATYAYLPSTSDYVTAKESLIADLSNEDMFRSGAVANPSEDEVIDSVQKMIQEEVFVIGLSMLVGIFIIVWMCLRSFRFAIVSLTPMLAGGVAVLGSYVLLFGSISSINLLWFPIYMGLAIDDAIHVGNNLKLYNGDLKSALSGCGGAIVLTSLTTMIGFGSFGLSPFPLLQQAGFFICLAMAWELLASLIFLPAFIRITGVDKIARLNKGQK